MKTFSDVIDALGIPDAAGILGKPESHIRVLKARDSIPPDYFKSIVDSAQAAAKGITFDLLYKLRKEKVSKQRRSKKRSKVRAPLANRAQRAAAAA